jgi:hypothetical protein
MRAGRTLTARCVTNRLLDRAELMSPRVYRGACPTWDAPLFPCGYSKASTVETKGRIAGSGSASPVTAYTQETGIAVARLQRSPPAL